MEDENYQEDMVEEENHEDIEEDTLNDVEDKVNALMDLLVEKGVLSEEEIDKKIDAFYEDE
tara:strand:- start:389 stop:571 length:183 start_codon:yes stop_codon:yes gene_type:complete